MSDETLAQLTLTRLRASERTTFLFFEITTSSGRTGVGEATMSGDDAATAAAARTWFDEFLNGVTVSHAPARLDEVVSIAKARESLVHATALSALEQCIWDLRGQVLGLPVYELLGGLRRDVIGLYANVNRGTIDRSPDGFAAAARSAVDAGFTAVKCAPFDGVHPSDAPGSPNIRLALERLAAVRAAIGEQTRLMVDCHGRLSADVVVSVIPDLLDIGIYWLEEPVMSHPQMATVIGVADGVADIGLDGDGLGLPPAALFDAGIVVAGGEFDYGLDRFATILREARLSFLMPDVKHCGGVGVAATIGAMAAGHGVRLSPHNPSGPVATVASMHVCAAASNFEMLEYQWAEVPARESMTTPFEPRVGGVMQLSDAAGFGIALDHDAIASLALPLN